MNPMQSGGCSFASVSEGAGWSNLRLRLRDKCTALQAMQQLSVQHPSVSAVADFCRRLVQGLLV